ncbi:hypothetical protein OOZ19_03535 [Saccharopolyspora sp. NFXS83]|uniref:hypothetical protein n=1 Tax=Saccharopolyspora sp. NFXS83 TaxID=2993560 RepID=UPI00224AE2BA|nr:hypothetical protein [Saccharopolyspora sp. NFXS83]MCX2729300.1 hypothetical protein [Saccharopolyspora sp. NFXS83]
MDESESGDLAGAIDVLAAELELLTGHRPMRRRLVPGQAHVHRIALTWCGRRDEPEVCLQVLAQRAAAGNDPGWLPAEAGALAEAVDIKARTERFKDRDAGIGARSARTGPDYHLVLRDIAGDRTRTELDGRCAALEAGYLDGAGWMRLYTGGRFGEGSFTRVVQRVRNDVRTRLGDPVERQPNRNQGLC